MSRRALVIASQTGGLTGCHNDADLVADLLGEHGFEIVSLRGPTATRASILDAYESLIEVTRPSDAVLVYYAGHGSRVTGAHPSELRFILPTDMGERDFRGILADELSILQWRLTTRTANVTTVLDCCYSARMSRDAGGDGTQARGRNAAWSADAVVSRWQSAVEGYRRLREAHPDSVAHDANPSAVRMVACGSLQQACEGYAAEFDAVHGFFTAALVSALRADPDGTWDAIGERVRQRVLARMPIQRPEAEGPVRRIAFTATERDHRPSYPVRVDPETGLAWLDAAVLRGIRLGDEVLLAEADAWPDPATAPLATVTKLSGQAALLRPADGQPIAPGTTAQLSRDRLVVRLRADDGEPVPTDFRDALTGMGVREGPAVGTIATIAVTGGRYLLYDAAGQPLYRDPRPANAASASRLRGELAGLASALRLRDLDQVTAEFPATVSLTVTCDGEPVTEDSVLHVGDWLAIRVGNDALTSGIVYGNVLDLGVAGKVSVLNTAEPAGMALPPGETRTIGMGPEGHQPGIPLSWPPGVPDDRPRFETLVAVFSDRPQDLRDLEHDGIAERGRRDFAPADLTDQYAIRRVTILLCPGGDGCAHPPRRVCQGHR